MGKGYTSDDNRSMQLNPNNDRYYSSRGIDRYDDDYDDDYENSLYGSKPKSEFKEFIDIEEYLPYFQAWIKNIKINTGKSYFTTTLSFRSFSASRSNPTNSFVAILSLFLLSSLGQNGYTNTDHLQVTPRETLKKLDPPLIFQLILLPEHSPW